MKLLCELYYLSRCSLFPEVIFGNYSLCWTKFKVTTFKLPEKEMQYCSDLSFLVFFFFLEISMLIQQGCIKSIKSEVKTFILLQKKKDFK